jgi:metal-responsive CopG/Arc/MetJ family transcriptional regulator
MKEGLTEKVQIMVPPSLIQQIDDWRFANRVTSRSRAMRKLLALALVNEEKGPAEAATSPSHVTHNPS